MDVAGDLAREQRLLYRAEFQSQVAAGARTPLLFHIYIVGSQLLPALYLAIPHRRRPWLYRARWLVLAAAAGLQWWMLRNGSSASFAGAYGVGLLAAWGLIWNLALLVWTRPQWEARRVVRRRGAARAAGGREAAPRGEAPEAASDVAPSRRLNGSGSNGHAVRERRKNGGVSEQKAPNGELKLNGKTESADVDVDASGNGQEYIYEWQEFPENESFLTRLGWAFSLTTSLRLTGWNWAIPVLPPCIPPPTASDGSQMPLESLPDRSPQGFSRVHKRRDFVLQRVFLNIIPSYLVLDFLATYMTQDPYFVVGPSNLPLPPHLASLSPVVLHLNRSMCCFSGIIAALQLLWNFGAVMVTLLGPPLLGLRAEPWHMPTIGGSFVQVLDRGLGGFWGSWWHQSFRFGFTAPTRWMIRNGYLKKGSVQANVVGALVAFAQSSFLHVMGSYTTMPPSRLWNPPIFFMLAGVGVLVQHALSQALKPQIEKMPRYVRRAANLVFAATWLLSTCGPLFDDFGGIGLWLFEPVPFSVIRWLGYGIPGDSAWRLLPDDHPKWYTGKHWWQSGFGI